MAVISNIKAKFHEWVDGSYYVGIVENADQALKSPSNLNINWIKVDGLKSSWLADPFILEHTEKTITILVEEYDFLTCKGNLSEIIVDREQYSIISIHQILNQDNHLSFPYYVKHNNQIYIIPESGQSNEAAIYTFNSHNVLERKRQLINEKLLDTQIAHIGDKWYAFATKMTEEGLDATKKLFIYESENLYGEYKEIQQIANTKNEERGAGLIFEYEGKLLRPAQVCNNGYGKGVILYKLTLYNGEFIETEYARFMANPKNKNGLCLHTFSVHNNLIAVDGFDYKMRWLGYVAPILYKVKDLTNKLKQITNGIFNNTH